MYKALTLFFASFALFCAFAIGQAYAEDFAWVDVSASRSYATSYTANGDTYISLIADKYTGQANAGLKMEVSNDCATWQLAQQVFFETSGDDDDRSMFMYLRSGSCYRVSLSHTGNIGVLAWLEASSTPSSGGTATTSPYIIDVGSTVMLGGILMFLIAYWFVGLIRSRNR